MSLISAACLLPGVLLCVLVTAAAAVLQRVEVWFAGEPYTNRPLE